MVFQPLGSLAWFSYDFDNWSELSDQEETRPNLSYKIIVMLLPKLIALTSRVS